MHCWDLFVCFQTWNYLFSFLLLEDGLIAVENTRENYFYVAKHPVPFEGGRTSPYCLLS